MEPTDYSLLTSYEWNAEHQFYELVANIICHGDLIRAHVWLGSSQADMSLLAVAWFIWNVGLLTDGKHLNKVIETPPGMVQRSLDEEFPF